MFELATEDGALLKVYAGQDMRTLKKKLIMYIWSIIVKDNTILWHDEPYCYLEKKKYTSS